MTSTLNSLTEFSAAVAALGLTDREKEVAFALLGKAEVNLNDPTALNYVAIVKMESVVNKLHANFINDGKALIAKLKTVVGEELTAQLASVPDNLSKQIEGTLETALHDLVSNVDLAVTKEAQRRQTFRIAGLGLGAAMLTILAVGGGYAVGKTAVTSEAANWSALVSLPQGKTWLSLARWNDIDRVMAQSCGPSDGRVISGGKACALTLFTSQPVATSKGIDYVRLSLAEQANKLGWLGYGLMAVLGGLAGFFIRGRRSAR
ncbi:hypothetical protein AMC83_PA00013 (plasmid) [Rhizobium phaseoli]|uniref:hypothetical protein n=1 Tax=Rhizobium phaseoli TaxID=396 RepID=UPI0007E95E7A|nr:hypothetical protein [Rhizobium phaseoli]ANL74240.1 hypothetical protein AMC83_PA00013 [Rhizobium phaseoli]